MACQSLLSGGKASGFSLPHLWCDDLVMFVRNTTDEIRRRNPTLWISAAQTERIPEYSSHITDFTDFSSHITSHSSMCMLSIEVLDFVEKIVLSRICYIKSVLLIEANSVVLLLGSLGSS